MSAPLHTQIPARLTKASASPAMQPLLYVLGFYMYRAFQIARHPSCSPWPFQNENGPFKYRNGPFHMKTALFKMKMANSVHVSRTQQRTRVKQLCFNLRRPRVPGNLRNPVKVS